MKMVAIALLVLPITLHAQSASVTAGKEKHMDELRKELAALNAETGRCENFARNFKDRISGTTQNASQVLAGKSLSSKAFTPDPIELKSTLMAMRLGCKKEIDRKNPATTSKTN